MGQRTTAQLRPSASSHVSSNFPEEYTGKYTKFRSTEKEIREKIRAENSLTRRREVNKKFAGTAGEVINGETVPFDRSNAPSKTYSNIGSGDAPDRVLQNKHLPTKNVIPRKKTGLRHTPVVDTIDEGTTLVDGVQSADAPDWCLSGNKRIRQVKASDRNWYNGGTKGLKSTFQTDYGVVSDSTVS